MTDATSVSGSPRRVWVALEGPDVVEMKQVVLDRDMAGAVAFFQRVVVPRVRTAAQRRGIPIDTVEQVKEKKSNGCLPG